MGVTLFILDCVGLVWVTSALRLATASVSTWLRG